MPDIFTVTAIGTLLLLALKKDYKIYQKVIFSLSLVFSINAHFSNYLISILTVLVLFIITRTKFIPKAKKELSFLLPTIIFSCSDRDGGKLKEEMKKKLDLLSRNLWDTFTLESLSLKVILPGGVTTTEQAQRRAEKLIKAGQLSRAYKAIVGDKNRLTPCDDVFNALSEKYPAEGINRLTDDQMNELNAFRFNENVQRPSVSVESLGKIILKGGHMIAHGIDHFRYEHLQKLWGYKDQDSHQQEFRLLYTKLINPMRTKRCIYDTSVTKMRDFDFGLNYRYFRGFKSLYTPYTLR
jgi:hypothetical protein